MGDPQLTVDEVVDRILEAVDSDGDGKLLVTCHTDNVVKALSIRYFVVSSENISPSSFFFFFAPQDILTWKSSLEVHNRTPGCSIC